MPSTRFRSGVVQLVRFPVGSATVIEPGDLLCLVSGVVVPAADFAWQTDAATTRAAFAAAFVGIAHTASEAGETDDVSVDISPMAVYECDVISAAYAVGDPLTPTELSSTLSSRTLEMAGSVAEAIARAVETRESGATTVRAGFASSIHPGSANVNAAVG